MAWTGTNRIGQRTHIPLMMAAIDAIEKLNPFTVGMYCSAGHHRSVGLAELQRRRAYLRALVMHHCAGVNLLVEWAHLFLASRHA